MIQRQFCFLKKVIFIKIHNHSYCFTVCLGSEYTSTAGKMSRVDVFLCPFLFILLILLFLIALFGELSGYYYRCSLF